MQSPIEAYSTEYAEITIRPIFTPGGTSSHEPPRILYWHTEIPLEFEEALKEVERGEIYDLDSAFDGTEDP